MPNSESSRALSISVGSDDDTTTSTQVRKKPRKSRSRGLRTRSGCLTCRKRHKKCDEQVPVCGSCTLANRTCVYGDIRPTSASQATVTTASSLSGTLLGASQLIEDNAAQYVGSVATLVPPPVASAAPHEAAGPDGSTQPCPVLASEIDTDFTDFISGSSTTPLQAMTRPASSGMQEQAREQNLAVCAYTPVSSWLRLSKMNPTALTAVDACEASDNWIELVMAEDTHKMQFFGPMELWREKSDIRLIEIEADWFAHYIEHTSLWLDMFDPQKYFSTYLAHLAMRNFGLMKAILALSIQHTALPSYRCPGVSDVPFSIYPAHTYYNDSLDYVILSLCHRDYSSSNELLATSVILLVYEMLKDSCTAWQRHLKGVSWILAGQGINGSSGGFQQAAWWAWFYQDVWYAFLEKRQCLSSWKWPKDAQEPTKLSLINRAIYLLGEAVNYASSGDTNPYGDPASKDEDVVSQRTAASNEIMGQIDSWKADVGIGLTPLPVLPEKARLEFAGKRPFTPIWIHPPENAVALMLTTFAKILIALHRPLEPGFGHYLKMQKELTEAVSTICGIAMMMRDEASQLMTAHCLYGVGLCTHNEEERDAIITLIKECEKKSHWPMDSLCNGLRDEWHRVLSDTNP